MNEPTNGSGPTPHDRTVLTVRVATPETVFDELEERFAALDAGERPESKHEVVVQREEDLERLLNPRTLRLLRTIAREQPASIRETARFVGRDVRQVHDDLSELERMHLLRFEEEATAKRPVVWYDDVELELPIADGDGSFAPA